MLEGVEVVDLTQPLGADTIVWPGAPQPVAETILTIAHDGFYNRRITVVEHAGTHFDAPSHMVEGGATVDRIPAERLVRPLIVIDIADELAGDPDGILTVEQVHAFEAASLSMSGVRPASVPTRWGSTPASPRISSSTGRSATPAGCGMSRTS